MRNFLEETKECIVIFGRKEEDVMFVGSSDGKYRISFEEFKKIADFEYDSGYGAAEIATDLIVYFKDHSCMFRWEYDGSEGWEFHKIETFSEEDECKPIKKLGGHDVMWKTIEELHS